jgi:hypothetical protein
MYCSGLAYVSVHLSQRVTEIINILNTAVYLSFKKVKVKQYLYMPGVAQRVPRSQGPQVK